MFGHNVTLFDPYYGKTTQTTGHTETARIQAIAVDPITSIITANNDKRKSGANTGYWCYIFSEPYFELADAIYDLM